VFVGVTRVVMYHNARNEQFADSCVAFCISRCSAIKGRTSVYRYFRFQTLSAVFLWTQDV